MSELLLKIGTSEGSEFTPEDLQRSNELSNQIEKTLEDIQQGHSMFVSSFARLGTTLHEVRSKKYWKLWGFDSFGKFIQHIEEKVNKGRSQIYNSITVAERLLPYVSTEQIEKMGITKATELGKVVKNTGIPPTNELITYAVDPEIEAGEFKAAVYETYNVRNMDEKGKFRDLGGFYATDELWKEIERAHDVACRVDPVIPMEYSEWERRREIHTRLCREFLATYEALVERGEG